MPASVQRSGPGLAGLAARLEQLRKSDVLIGIPADRTVRRGETLNNATLLYIHSKGSDLAHIPARPVLEPSIKANNKIIAPHLAAAAQAMLERDPVRVRRELNLAGMIASNGAKRWFTDPRNGWAPNAPSTIRAKGSDKPLIDTGILRRSLTFVVRQEKAGRSERSVGADPDMGDSVEATSGIAASEGVAVESGQVIGEIL